MTKIHLTDLDILGHILILISGCMAGVWVSFGARNVEFAFENLVMPERDRLEPQIRLLFAGVVALLFGIALSLRVIEIQMGSVSTSKISESIWLAFLIGAFCGLSEKALTDTITQRAVA